MPGDTLLDVKAVTRKTTIGTTKIYEMLKAGSFPPPVRIGPQTVRWRESEIDQWIARLPYANRNDTPETTA